MQAMTLPPDIGLPSRIYPDETLAAAFELLSPRTGLVEIDSFGLHTVLSPRNRRDALASGLRLTVHGPYGFDIEPGSPDEAVRVQAVAQHRRHIEAAAEIGALLYVVHPDYMEPPGPRDQAVVDALQRTIADLAELQRATGLRIALENMPGVGASHFTAPGDLELGELGLTLDCGHAAISGTLDDFLSARGPVWPTSTCTTTGARPTATTRIARSVWGWSTRRRCSACARDAGATVILEHLDEPAALASIAYLKSSRLV